MVGDTEGEESVLNKLNTPDEVNSGAHNHGDVLQEGGQAVRVGALGQQGYFRQFPSHNVMS